MLTPIKSLQLVDGSGSPIVRDVRTITFPSGTLTDAGNGAVVFQQTVPVTSVFGRTGAVIAQAGDYSTYYDAAGSAAAVLAAVVAGYVPVTRTVNGHPLSANVSVTASDIGLGNVENTALSTWAGSTNITTVGTITTGVWSGTALVAAKLPATVAYTDVANTFTVAQIVSVAGAASAPPVKLTGAWYTGGTSTTTKPQLLVEPAGTTSTGWSTSGTGIGVNAASGFAGNLADYQVGGVRYGYVDNLGGVWVGNSAQASVGSFNWTANSGGGGTAIYIRGNYPRLLEFRAFGGLCWYMDSVSLSSRVDIGGGTGWATRFNTLLEAVAPTAASIPFKVRGATSQTANLQEWQNSSSVVGAKVTAALEFSNTGAYTNSEMFGAGAVVSGNNGIAIGPGTTVGGQYSIGIGFSVGTGTGSENIIIGNASVTHAQCISIGINTAVTGDAGVVIGKGANAAEGAFALGAYAAASAVYALAIGGVAGASHFASTSIGRYAVSSADYDITLGFADYGGYQNQLRVVSATGNPDATRSREQHHSAYTWTSQPDATRTSRVVHSITIDGVRTEYVRAEGTTGNTVPKISLAGGVTPASLADSAAANGTIYYSTTAGKLVYKDSSGVVNPLY